MYLKRILCENMGAIDKVDLELGFNDNASPKPLILVGKNGSGKSILISNIVDSFYEFSNQAFSDVTFKDKQGNFNSYKYFKILSLNQIKINKNFMYAYLEFEDGDKNLKYCIKGGKIKYEDFCEKNSIENDESIRWNESDECKKYTTDNEYFKNEFELKTYCYFPPNRYEKPHWINKEYIGSDYDCEGEHIRINPKINGYLQKPITVQNTSQESLKWLLDVIADSRVDVIKVGESNYQINAIEQNIELLSKARQNIEKILSDIVGEDCYFNLKYRNAFDSRFEIKSKKSNLTLIPTLDSLSTGENALFNIFSTIIRYSDFNDIMKSIDISEITGVVVIDEIELHLHSDLQREILPKLIKRFPKVQFIITSHSPLFLLGMQDEFGDDEFDIYQMPNGEKIDVERFSEFQNAYKYLSDTELHRNDIKKAIESFNTEETLIITEGSTDWKHMLRALKKLKLNGEYKDRYKELKDAFLKYEPKNSTKECDIKIEMGKDSLIEMCRSFSKLKRNNKIIFIGDRDDKNTNRTLMCDYAPFKKWGNNVYSFIIPVPEHRKATPDICIEHYYTDEEIKTFKKCEDGINRRLYIGKEFDEDGINHTEKKYCRNKNICGKDKINIIEGSSKERVISINDTNEIKTNYALSKTEFAEAILNEEDQFKCINCDDFHLIFDIIKDILDDKN